MVRLPEVVVEGGCGRWMEGGWKVDGRWMKVAEGGCGRWLEEVGRWLYIFFWLILFFRKIHGSDFFPSVPADLLPFLSSSLFSLPPFPPPPL